MKIPVSRLLKYCHYNLSDLSDTNLSDSIGEQASIDYISQTENYLMIFNHRKAAQFIENIRLGKLLIGRSSDREPGLINFKIPIDGFSDVENELYRYCKPH